MGRQKPRRHLRDRKEAIAKLDLVNPMQARISESIGDGCMICGDDPDGLFRWKNEHNDVPPAPMCADCAEIQQRMYGGSSGDTLLKVSA